MPLALGVAPRLSNMQILPELCFQIARRRLRDRSSNRNNDESGKTDPDQYRHWRDRELESSLDSFPVEFVSGRAVLDFGCGEGGLSLALHRLGARKVTGVDISDAAIESARARARGLPIEFVRSSSESTIDLPSDSVDVVVCFDVMEHVIEYRSIMQEWRRVVRPGGRILVNWQPWFHPYGHHVHAYVPLPWVHVVLSEEEITGLCARIVDLPDYHPPFWDRDEIGRKINRFRHASSGGYLNRLTMSRFERVCRELGLEIERAERVPFRGARWVTAVSYALNRLPLFREFFTATAIYVIRNRK